MASILLIGGSGFVSGTIARRAVARGDEVWAVSRGRRAMPDGVIPIIADRNDRDRFSVEISALDRHWDLVVDCIAFEPEDAQQDIDLFRDRAGHLVFISSDFVFDPAHRRFPQTEETDFYLSGDYGGRKRLCETALIDGDTGDMAWSAVRPCHIYGAGSRLGCFPRHVRDEDIIDRIRAGRPLDLLGGGCFLQQPVHVGDLADLILAMPGNAETDGEIYLAAGPDTIESREYYFIIADILGVDRPEVNEIPVNEFLKNDPHRAPMYAPFCCHRIYDLEKLRSAGLPVPTTDLRMGLAEHVGSLTGSTSSASGRPAAEMRSR